MKDFLRLNHYISKSGMTSRRKADELIKLGKVTVDGRKIFEPFFRVKDGQQVEVSGKRIWSKEHIYLLFNKPIGVTTTLRDRFASQTINDFIPDKYKGAYPVGRLDKNSSGLIILTNDGDFCYKTTHPKFLVEKEYLIRLKGILSDKDCRQAIKGVYDQGEHLKIKQIKILNNKDKETLCKVMVSEGKKRHLRRLFKKLGFAVVELTRVRIGQIRLGDLKPGKFKVVSKPHIHEKLSLFL